MVLVVLWLGATSAGVDTAGHLGGLAAGILAGLCAAPRTLPPGRLLRVVPLALALLLATLAARPRWRTERDAEGGLVLRLPSAWQPDGDRPGAWAFSNGLPGRGQARLAAQRLEVGEGTGREALTQWLREAGLGPEAAADAIRVAGLPALRLQAQGAAPAGPLQHVALLVPLGDWVYALGFQYALDVPAYGALVQQMVDGVRFEEPAALLRARAQALLLPGAGRPLAALGAALRRHGQPLEARAALTAALEQAPADVEVRGELTRALLQTGHVDEGCQAAEAALTYDPHAPAALQAQARCLLARGESAQASGLAGAAQRLAPVGARVQAAGEGTPAAASPR
jgi:tetratricopeptide (TPR) repeat protein